MDSASHLLPTTIAGFKGAFSSFRIYFYTLKISLVDHENFC